MRKLKKCENNSCIDCKYNTDAIMCVILFYMLSAQSKHVYELLFSKAEIEKMLW